MGRSVRPQPVQRRFAVAGEDMTWAELMGRIREIRQRILDQRNGQPMDIDALLAEVRGLSDQDRS